MLLHAVFGDVYGLGYEYVWPEPRSDWIEDFDPRAGCARFCRGRCCYSDDTEMMAILVEHLLENECRFSEEGFAKLLSERAQIDDSYRYYGISTKEVIRALRSGTPWYEASEQVFGGEGSYGNGAAIRVLPMVFVSRSFLDLAINASRQARVTHAHPLGVEGAVLLASAQFLAFRGEALEILPQRVLETREWSPVYAERLRRIESLLDADPRRVARELGNSASAVESVVTAIYVAIKSRGDPLKALGYAVSIGGDVDSIASMALSIVGAYSDISRIEPYLNDIESIEYLDTLFTTFVGRCVRV